MDTRAWAVFWVSVAAFLVCGYSLLPRGWPQLFGSETIRLRLRFPHVLVCLAAPAAALGLICLPEAFQPPPLPNLDESVFLSLATVLVLFMLFGFIAFEAGTVSAAYRNKSTEKNLLVVVFSLASYLSVGCNVYHFVAGKPIDAFTANVYQAAFACTASLILANAITERASLSTNLLCSTFLAGFGYPILAGLVWGQTGLLHKLGFHDASGAMVVHLFGASASLFAAAAVGPRVRLQRRKFLGWPETPDFRSPWSVVGGLFLMFGWLGFNSGTAQPDLRGHAFYNTIVGACSGAIAAWAISRGTALLKRMGSESGSIHAPENEESRQVILAAIFRELETRPRIVIGMMGGLVAVTANGAFEEVAPWMASIESLMGGAVAVVVSTWMSARSRAERIDDPLGAIGTHGCAALVGLLATAVWFKFAGKPFWQQFIAQLTGCGACLVVGWIAAMVPCWVLLTTERQALKLPEKEKKRGSWIAAKFRLCLGAIEQLGMPRETPLDLEWNDRIAEAMQSIKSEDEEHDEDAWWRAIETCAAAADVLDKSSQVDIACCIAKKLQNIAHSSPEERIAFVAMSGSAEYANANDIRTALDECVVRAEKDRHDHAETGAPDRMAMLVWTAGVLTERAAVLGKTARPEFLEDAERGIDFLRRVEKSAKDDRVCELARRGIIDSNSWLHKPRVTGNGAHLHKKTLRQDSWRDLDPQIQTWRRELDSFKRQLPILRQVPKYDNQFVAIYEGEVVDFDASKAALARRVSGSHPGKVVFIGDVSHDIPTFEMPSPEES